MATINDIQEWVALGKPTQSSTLGVQPCGVKYDGSKLRYSLIPLDSLQEVVKVLEFGAKKYAPDNWKYVDDAQARYWDAAMRHIVAYKLEDKTDSETGLSHLAHAICCLLFLINFDNHENNK